MTPARDGGRSPAEFTHRRETLLYILLPMLGVVALLGLGLGVVLLLPKPGQVSIIADWMFTVFCLCPAALCLFPMVILMVAAVAGMNILHDKTLPPLKRLEMMAATLNSKTAQLTNTIGRKTIDVSVKFAFVNRMLSIFDPPSPSPNGEKEE
jgi:ABC-type methionine transport system permease subunit